MEPENEPSKWDVEGYKGPLYRLGEFYFSSGRALERRDDDGKYAVVGFLDDRIAQEVIAALTRKEVSK